MKSCQNYKQCEVIAIDFDGTITMPSEYPITGEIRPEAIRVIKQLQNRYLCVLWTCRKGAYLDEALQLLRKEGIEFKYINSSPYPDRGSNKIYADVYIDDKNIGTVIDWDEIEKLLL